MNFVDYINFVLSDDGRILDLFAKVADFVHRAVGRGVDFQNIHIAGLLKFDTSRAFPTRIAVYGVFAVNRARKNSRDGGFPRAASPREKVCVRNVVRFNLIDKRPYDMSLPDDLVERNRTVSSVLRNVCHSFTFTLV